MVMSVGCGFAVIVGKTVGFNYDIGKL